MPTVSSNTTGPTAVAFTASNQTWTILAGISVWGTNTGVASGGFTNNTLTNRGHVVGEAVGVSMQNNSTVNNAPGATIQGYNFGVFFIGSTTRAVLNNSGHIFSTGIAVDFSSTAAGAKLVNRGDISGMGVGVLKLDAADGGRIINFGRIHSDDFAIQISSLTGQATVVINHAGAVIDGTNASFVSGGTGALALTNNGIVRGELNLDASNVKDRVVNHGLIQGPVNLGSGDDVFNGDGGRSGKIFGEVGLDRLAGGNFADRIHGGADKDTMTGRGGPDRFDFDMFSDSVLGNADRITDFKHGQHDRIDLADVAVPVLVFRGKAAFTGTAPEVRYALFNPAGTANDVTRVFVDYNGDGTPDMEIHLKGLHALVPGDFVL